MFSAEALQLTGSVLHGVSHGLPSGNGEPGKPRVVVGGNVSRCKFCFSFCFFFFWGGVVFRGRGFVYFKIESVRFVTGTCFLGIFQGLYNVRVIRRRRD